MAHGVGSLYQSCRPTKRTSASGYGHNIADVAVYNQFGLDFPELRRR